MTERHRGRPTQGRDDQFSDDDHGAAVDLDRYLAADAGAETDDGDQARGVIDAADDADGSEDFEGTDDFGEDDDYLAAEVVSALTAAGQTVATAESLTGGLVCAVLTDVPGASVVVRGAVVAYATDVKSDLLDVSATLLASAGPVHPVVATTMARSVRARLATTYGLATTGVAGPDPQGEQPVGTVYVAVDGPDGSSVERHRFGGDRMDIRAATVTAALRLLLAEAGADTER